MSGYVIFIISSMGKTNKMFCYQLITKLVFCDVRFNKITCCFSKIQSKKLKNITKCYVCLLVYY